MRNSCCSVLVEFSNVETESIDKFVDFGGKRCSVFSCCSRAILFENALAQMGHWYNESWILCKSTTQFSVSLCTPNFHKLELKKKNQISY